MRSILKRVRHEWWLVSYHSSTRRRTIWTRLGDGAIVATFLLAPCAMLAGEALVERPIVVSTVDGRISRDDDGDLLAEVVGPDGAGPWGDVYPFGEWRLNDNVVRRGWPLASARASAGATLDLNLYDQPNVRRNARLRADAPVRLAIEDALRREGEDRLLASWGTGGGTVPLERKWLGTLAGIMVWWATLAMGSLIVIRLASFVAKIVAVHREGRMHGRVSIGRCATCNYDLRGLEFHERCPECGSLQH